MTFPTPPHWLLVLLASLLLFTAVPLAGHAAGPAQPPGPGPAAIGIMGAFTDGVLGNRSRMIQFAFVGFGIGVLILVTATRKH